MHTYLVSIKVCAWCDSLQPESICCRCVLEKPNGGSKTSPQAALIWCRLKSLTRQNPVHHSNLVLTHHVADQRCEECQRAAAFSLWYAADTSAVLSQVSFIAPIPRWRLSDIVWELSDSEKDTAWKRRVWCILQYVITVEWQLVWPAYRCVVWFVFVLIYGFTFLQACTCDKSKNKFRHSPMFKK